MTDDVSPDVIKTTQKLLGKHIKRPPLTDKLLKKPPFRFLHDIVSAVIKETGFLKGLYSDAELQSENVKEREAKVGFLNRLIDAVNTIAQVELQVRPSKIISGLEPTETNLLLQALGSAIDAKLDSSQYVAQVKGTKEPSKSKTKPSKNETDRAKKPTKSETDRERKKAPSKPTAERPEKPKLKKQDSDQASNRTEKRRTVRKDPSPREPVAKASPKDAKTRPERTKRESSKESVNSTRKEKISPRKELTDVIENHVDVPETKVDSLPVDITDGNVIEMVNGFGDGEKHTGEANEIKNEPESKGEVKTEMIMDDSTKVTEVIAPDVDKIPPKRENTTLERPKSARPRSGDLRRERTPSAKPKLIDLEKEMRIENSPVRPKSSLRPPSVRPTSARPGAPRLRPDSALPMKEMVPLGKINVIVENYSAQDDEEETVVIQSVPDVDPDPPAPVLDIPADKGHLVEQILEQLHEDDILDNAKTKVDIDWEQEGFRGRDSMNKEITHLRNAIQTLTRTANPLGKLMNFLHEDLEAMHIELNMWTTTKRQIKVEIANQKRINEDITKPLRNKLLELEENIKKQEDEISGIRGEILRNDMRIKELLSDQI